MQSLRLLTPSLSQQLHGLPCSFSGELHGLLVGVPNGHQVSQHVSDLCPRCQSRCCCTAGIGSLRFRSPPHLAPASRKAR